MSLIHFSNYKSVADAIVGFSKVCRENGLPIGLSHTKEAISIAKLGLIKDENTFRYSLRSLFCTCTEDHEIFDKCFDVYWLTRKHNYSHKFSKGTSNVSKKSKASLVMMGFNPNGNKEESEDDKDDASNVTGASKIDALKSTDFSKVSAIDSEYLDELVDRLLHQLNHRLKRKLKVAKQGKIDFRNTVRRNISKGDTLIDLVRKNRSFEKYKLILLLDVSGSMDKYSFYLLKFLWALKSNLKKIESFIFSTRLIRITDVLDYDHIQESLSQLSFEANNWSGGTAIGECLKAFNDDHAKRILNGKSITIVLSDGLDNGDSELLKSELQKIKMRTSKLVWLNPLKGTEGYEPLAKGMSSALPLVDTFQSAHNLESLMELENILSNV